MLPTWSRRVRKFQRKIFRKIGLVTIASARPTQPAYDNAVPHRLVLPLIMQMTRSTEIMMRSSGIDRGRNARYRAPPAQIRTCGTPAYGSHLGYLTANRWCGQG